ncbi:MAG: hypothetical protein ACE5HT_15115 [Gemmatimonadales bacterium]
MACSPLRLSRLAIVVSALLLTRSALALANPVLPAHPEGVIKLANSRFAAGISIQVDGAKFHPGSILRLQLVGTDATIDLTEVQVDSGGTFVHAVDIPAGLQPGSYRLVALASDGDVAAGLDVMVLARAVEEEHADTHEEDEHDEPSAEPLVLERAHSPLVTGGAITGIVLAFALGGVLLYRNHNGN